MRCRRGAPALPGRVPVAEAFLDIQGARVHNLRNVSLRLPHHRLNVVTGVSGSGKSSLVFDLIHAEGRRRYVESLSSYARQFLERLDKPDVDEIEGVAPTVAIRQRNSTRSTVSTVATATEIHDFLRVLMARIGRTFCEFCEAEVRVDTVDAVVATILRLEASTRWYALFPVSEFDRSALAADKRYAAYKEPLFARLASLRDRGFNRLYQDGREFEFSSPETLIDIDPTEEIYVVADRLTVAPSANERIADAVETAFVDCGEVIFRRGDGTGATLRFTSRFECNDCGTTYDKPQPQMFVPGSAYGTCDGCSGRGSIRCADPELLVDRPERSLSDGAISAWQGQHGRKVWKPLRKEAAKQRIPLDVPYIRLTPQQKEWVLQGSGKFPGVDGFLERCHEEHWGWGSSKYIDQCWTSSRCPDCDGTRLSKDVLCVRLAKESMAGLLKLTLEESLRFFESLELTAAEARIGEAPLAQILSRLRFLNEVGLGYLALDRPAASLSGGEMQRIQLATALGSSLAGVCYVLDEPSIGLHPRDTGRLIGILKRLRDMGNTILVVEHDLDMMRAADFLLDLGPAGGHHGGMVTFIGTPDALHARNGSLTARYLTGAANIPVPAARRPFQPARVVRFESAWENNLKGIAVEVPLNVMTAITGVSGSGKSTLMHRIIHPVLEREATLRGVSLGRTSVDSSSYRAAIGRRVKVGQTAGLEHVHNVVLIGQDAIERSSRSIPATYIGVFDRIRKLFVREASRNGQSWSIGDFSFNSSGACNSCGGTGTETVDMQFLADVQLPCEECKGKRYEARVLDVRLGDKNIWDVLQLAVDEARTFFAYDAHIRRSMDALSSLGLGYLSIGQPTSALSGGEAQRLKLAHHLAVGTVADTMFLFDEPTTGLHFEDIRKLLAAFDKLLERRATVVVIEHNLDIIKSADWIIDLGPEGGEAGGRLIAAGTPEDVAQNTDSHTAKYLREALQ